MAGLLLLASAVSHAWADALSSSGSPSPASAFTMESAWQTGVGLVTDFRFLPDGRCVIITKDGGVLVRPAGGGALVPAGSFAVDEESEKGLLGLAVHPQFADNGQLVFYYSASDAAGGTDVDRQRVVMRTLDDANQLSASEVLLVGGLAGPHNHNGGALDVGPDGYLYVGVGDSGCNSSQPPEPIYPPTNFYGTCLADHPAAGSGANGKILRMALDGGIPPTNPLVGATNVTACGALCGTPISPEVLGDPRPEIWAWGFRNPFRLWVDPRTGRVWVGDVGETAYEEITIASAGRHHGWPWREGGRGHAPSQCGVVRIGTAPGGDPILDQDCVDPVYFCRHPAIADPDVDGSCVAITGGQIVDGASWPEAFRGRYLFADSATARVWSLVPTPARDGVTGGRADFARLEGAAPVALRTGPDEALYIAALPDRIVRIAPRAPASTTTTTLPAGGCAAACDDGDACTDDVCDGACRSTPVPGAAGVACLCTAEVEPCRTETLPSTIARLRTRACGQVARMGEGSLTARRVRKVARRASKRFTRAANGVRRAGGRRLTAGCATALATRLEDAAARAMAILDATPARR